MGCGCNEKKYSISMGCCQPVLGPIENYYTKPQIDKMIEEIESAVTSGCCITEEEVDEKIASAKTDIEAEIPSLSGYATEQWVEDKGYITGVDLSDYVTYEDMAEYVGDIYTKEEVNNLFVTKQYFTANTISRDVFITTIYNLNQEINSLKAAISACCSSTGETEYRWIVVPNDYTCSGTIKMTKEKQQSSTDGINWTDTGQYRTGSTVLEYNSTDCGYVPVSTYKVEMRYNDGTEDNRQCDGSSNLRALNPSNWENISGVTVGNCIDEIGNLCFYGFSGLTSVSLPNTVTKIDKMAFSRCVSLPSITLPTGLTEIGFDAFAYDSSLESIVIPSGVTVLEYGALKFCTSLTSVTLSEGIESIGNIALAYDDSLTNLTIPSTVTFIDEFAMAFNDALTTVTCLATTPPTLVTQNIFMGDNNLTAIYVPAASVNAYKSAWSEYAILIQAMPAPPKWIATYSDSHIESAECSTSDTIEQNEITKTDLVSVELGECVMTIGFAALNNCSGLTSVTIPNSVTSIDDNAFSLSSSLTSIDIPDSVTSIGHNAFYLCTSLITVTIGSGITSINYEAFAFCSALTAITVKATTPPTLGGTSPGGYVFYNTNNCPIYVPSGSVETYKTAWSTYADRIQAIP